MLEPDPEAGSRDLGWEQGDPQEQGDFQDQGDLLGQGDLLEQGDPQHTLAARTVL